MRCEAVQLSYPLSPDLIPAAAYSVWQRLKLAGFQCLFAGGWVRDLWMGHPSNDVDLATSASPDQVIALFKRSLALGKRFGSVIVLVEDDEGVIHNVEVTTFRKDGEYLDARRPETIELSDPEEDAERRDFTINGLFFDPEKNLIIDWVGGLKDIKDRKLRAIGEARLRFQEDRLRLLRAVRFATKLHFEIDEATRLAILEFAPTLMQSVSAERVWQELTKMQDHLTFSLTAMSDLGLLKAIFGLNLSSSVVAKQIGRLDKLEDQFPLVYRLAALWKPLEIDRELRLDPDCYRSLERLKLSTKERRWLEHLDLGLQLYRRDNELFDAHSWTRWLIHPQSEKALLWINEWVQDIRWKEKILTLSHTKLVQLLRQERTLFRAEALSQFKLVPGPAMGRLFLWLEQEASRLSLIDHSLLILHLQADSQGLKHLKEAENRS